MDLSEFLLARIAEDEERFVHDFDCDRFEVYHYGTRRGDCDCNATAQLLAECAAKRRIVEDWRKATTEYAEDQSGRIAALAFGEAIRALAMPYAAHPDYRDEWRP